MPWGAMRHYGRKIVVSEVAFDNAVSDEAKENRRNSLFCSSDSSHTSSLNSSATLFTDHAPQKPVTRHTRKTKKQNCLQSESRCKAKKKKKKKDDDSDSVATVHSGDSSLFHEGSQMCTPIRVKKKRGALVEINFQSSTRQAKVTRQAKPAGRQKNSKSNLARHVDSGDFTENMPDFDAIEQDDFIIASTPNGPQQCCHDRLGHSVSVMSPSLDVSDISGRFDNSGVRTGSSPLRNDQVDQHHANITFRTRKKTTKSQQRNSGDNYLPDSGNLSNNDADGSLLYELVDSGRLFDTENTEANSGITIDPSQLSDESSLASVSLRSCSVEDLSHSFRVMHLRSRDLTQRLLQSSQMSTAGPRSMPAADGDSLACELSVSPQLFDESSLSFDTHHPPLPQIAEEDTCYSEDAYDESEEYESDDKSDEEDSQNDDSKDEHDEVEEENEEVEEVNSEVEGEHYGETENRDDDKEMGDSMSTDIEKELMQEQQNSSKSNVTLYELVNSMSFSERLSSSSLCKDVTVTASERVLTLCGQTQPISFSDCIPPKMMSRCIKIGEGVYGEVFRSISCGETVALKIIPIEGHQQVNDCPQKKFDEILPEVVIARELSDLANCISNQTSNFCQVNRVSCVKGAFPSTLLEQWDLYSQKKVSENDRPDMFGDDQLFIVFEFLDGGCPLENYKFVNHMEALSMLRQVVVALAVAESHLEFEHRDLHIGNVLVRPCQDETISFVLRGREYQFPTAGVKATIIDFTISRLKKDGCAVFCDVSTDEGLFEGKGDFQFDVYRDMRTQNHNDWQVFCPHSNILWVNYLCKKLTSVIKVQDTGRSHRNVQRHLRGLVDTVLHYSCCTQMAEDLEIWSVPD